MKKLAFLVVFVLSTLGALAQNKPYCNLQGSIYASPTKQNTDYWVYVEDSEAFADMLVYEEENKLYADEPGIWFFVDNKGIADYRIYFTEEKSEADFVIYYTDSPTFAGCK